MTAHNDSPSPAESTDTPEVVSATSIDGTQTLRSGQEDQDIASLKKQARRAVWSYAGLRMLLFIVLTIVIQAISIAIGAPLLIPLTAALALFVAWPLSMLIFTKQRIRATTALAALSEQRKAEKAWMREELEQR
ncbi:MAG: DUF4229 domain-containing protein [Corynebacterium sp.]|nr:DUF4229 domain-containing protein [Corynebacterium sp.]